MEQINYVELMLTLTEFPKELAGEGVDSTGWYLATKDFWPIWTAHKKTLKKSIILFTWLSQTSSRPIWVVEFKKKFK